MKGVTLIGMPGAGKSTIGKLLAKRLNYQFVDLDIFMTQKENQGISEILKEKGDGGFIGLEEKYALGLNLANTVFSPGGSIIYSPKAMEKIKNETLVVYLSQPLSEIKRRLGKNLSARGIVGLKERGLAELFAERMPLYRKSAHCAIECSGLNDEEVINKIITLL